MIIRSAAHFNICACGEHGRLVTADGEESREFCSKEIARRAFDEAVKNGRIAEYETGEVLRQLNASSLTENQEDVPVAALTKTAATNILHDICLEQVENLPSSKYLN